MARLRNDSPRDKFENHPVEPPRNNQRVRTNERAILRVSLLFSLVLFLLSSARYFSRGETRLRMTCYDCKLQSTLIRNAAAEGVETYIRDTASPSARSPWKRERSGRHNTYEPGIIHRIGTKCLFTSSFELSKLGTISDLRLGSRRVPRVRSVIYVSPSPKRDAFNSAHLQPLLPTKHLPLHFNHYF